MKRATSVLLASTLILGGFQTSHALIEDDIKAPNVMSQQKIKDFKDHVPIFVQEKQKERFANSDVKNAMAYLNKNKTKHGIDSVEENLKAKNVEKDEIGMTHVRFNQEKNGIPIEGTEVIVHFNDQNEVVSVNGHVSDHSIIDHLNTSPKLSAKKAIELAISSVNAPEELKYEPNSELVIYPFEGDNYLAHKVNVTYLSDDPGNWFVYVDAHNGQIIDKFNALHPIEEYEMKDHKGVGTGVHGEHRKDLYMSRVKPDKEDTLFMLANHIHEGLEGIYTYDYNTGELATNDSASFVDEYHHPAVDAHYNSETVYEYYKEEHDRNSLDDEGMAIISYVNYGTNYNNAFWNGRHMTYGNGDGDFMVPLSAGLDVAAHEMTHGVITNTANLVYREQPGALNEAFADIFGALIDDENWEMGEDIMGPGAIEDGRTALRSLSDPSKFPVNEDYVPYGNGEGMYPSHMDEYYDLPLNLDNGGVHINSSIINHAAYLTAQEIGRDALGQIYYRALTHYLTPYSDFQEARQVIIQSAVDLYGEDSEEALATASGFDQVGIYEE
ncbi:M4 family metallopeptidase [Piscibacillus halophilus]|uniref:M4 family metallopeptidase n=1 Tax=Piscibacillus halophilus TaxID=571933 RepID=UPI00158A9A47|nr:M4 family metallopeptidase [Piscibacillus halophilus]